MNQKQKPKKRALVLQGDWECGMTLTIKDLQNAGTEVTKVIFNLGESFGYRAYNCIQSLKNESSIPLVFYDQPFEEFENWLRSYLTEHPIDYLILYNEYRPYNCLAKELIEKEFPSIEMIVLELGLLRPNYVTIYSKRYDLFDYLSERWQEVLKGNYTPQKSEEPPKLRAMKTGGFNPFNGGKLWQFGFFFSIASHGMACKKYPHFKDQRDMNFSFHFRAGLRHCLRSQGRTKQQGFNHIFKTRWFKRFYLAPLQLAEDSQISQRSTYTKEKKHPIEAFIKEVAASFIQFAPENTRLIFKVHPMDRGYNDYHDLIQKLNKKYETNRLLYLDKIDNPTALTCAKGCVMINSSMGLSSLINETPVKCLGEASFDLEGLTYQGTLNDFWTNAEPVNANNVTLFIDLLKELNQGYGTFYQRIFAVSGNAKIQWPSRFSHLFSLSKNNIHQIED